MATVQILPGSPATAGRAAGMANGRNAVEMVTMEGFREPSYFLYLYTVSKRKFQRHTPLFRTLNIPACGSDERYKLVTRVPEWMNETQVDPNNPERTITYATKGDKVIMDLCNPENTSGNLDALIDPTQSLAVGQNLIPQGVFWSKNNPPKEEEIAAAEQRRDNYYRLKLKQLDAISPSDPQRTALIDEDAHLACDHFGEERDWHRPFVQKVNCPNCGERIPKGIALHRSNGVLCVLDWKRAYKSGAVKYEDIPEEFRPKK